MLVELCDERCGRDVAIADGRIEAGLEQVDEQCRDVWVLHQRGFDVGLTEGERCLAEVFGVRPNDLDLAARQAGDQHQAVEAVALDRALEQLPERGLQLGGVVQRHAAAQPDADVVQRHRPLAETQRGWPLVQRLQTQLIEQR